MYYNHVCGHDLSALGFGLMRLPTTPDGEIDKAAMQQMVDCAMASGVNYYDTAFPYHAGKSETAIRECMKRYPRESYYLADKFPGHQIADTYDPAAVFEKQLKKCGVDYFDFYLLHNVNETSLKVYLDERWGIIPYFLEQRRLGRIRHLGFSCHGRLPLLREFLDKWGHEMEFCQIQLNYLDWTLQDAKAKYELLTERNIPVWVMEPVRGGKLANLPAEDAEALSRLRPGDSAASWCFRWLQGLDNVKMVLSGMTTLPQMEDNIATFAARCPTTAEENRVLAAIAEKMSHAVPCTACRYCCDGCPVELNIPMLINMYNDLSVYASSNVAMLLDAMDKSQWPTACVGCGQCAAICPQGIDVPGTMTALSEKIASMPTWAEISRQRALEAAQNPE